MDCGGYENYYIQSEELALILAGVGKTDWYGIVSETEICDYKMISTEKIYQIIADLYQKSYIEWSENAICLLEPVNSLARIMNKARFCLQIEVYGQENTLGCCYSDGGEIIWLEQSYTEVGMLRFSLWKEEEFLSYLWDKNVFPEEEMDSEFESGLESEENIRSTLSLRNVHTGLEVKKMVVSEQGIFTYVTIRSEDEMTRNIYLKERCEMILKQWLH